MAKYLFREHLPNEAFVFERIGEEGKSIRNSFFESKKMLSAIGKTKNLNVRPSNLVSKIKSALKIYVFKKLGIGPHIVEIGKFRMGGEIHLWMYDRYSLFTLLREKGGKDISVRDAFSSYIDNWADYDLDGRAGIVRKPDSLFMEAVK